MLVVKNASLGGWASIISSHLTQPGAIKGTVVAIGGNNEARIAMKNDTTSYDTIAKLQEDNANILAYTTASAATSEYCRRSFMYDVRADRHDVYG